jgi:hypothetical protein
MPLTIAVFTFIANNLTSLSPYATVNSDTPVYYFSQKKLSDMIDALIKRVSVTYKCYHNPDPTVYF